MLEGGWTQGGEASGSPETKIVSTGGEWPGRSEARFVNSVIKPYESRHWQPPHRNLDQAEWVVASREVPVHVSDKSAHHDTPVVVTVSVGTDRVKAASKTDDSHLVNLKLQISIERLPPTKDIDTKFGRTSKASKESPAGIKALSELITDKATDSLYEALTEGLPEGKDEFHLTVTADVVNDINQWLHERFGASVEDALTNAAGLPPELAGLGGDITEHVELSPDDWVEDKVKALRVVGIAIDILSGGLPIAEIFDFFFDRIKKAVADSICEALSPQPEQTKVHVNPLSNDKAVAPAPEPIVVNPPYYFGNKSKRLEDRDREPPHKIITKKRNLERSRDASGGRDEVVIVTGKHGPRDSSHNNPDTGGGLANRVQLRKKLVHLGIGPALARRLAKTAAADSITQILEDMLCGFSHGEDLDVEPDTRPHILAGQNDTKVICCEADETPSIAVGRHLTTGGLVFPPTPPKKDGSNRRRRS